MKTIPLAISGLLVLPLLIAGDRLNNSPANTLGGASEILHPSGDVLDEFPLDFSANGGWDRWGKRPYPPYEFFRVAGATSRNARRTRPATPVEAQGRDAKKPELEKPPGTKPQPAVGTLTSLDMETGELREIGSIPDYPIINSPEISPDGEWIGVDGWKAGENLRDARIFLVNRKNGSVINLVKGCMPSWSADGKWIAFCKYPPERGVYIRSLEDQTEKLIDADGWGIQWAPDGLKAAYIRGGRFVIYDFIGDTKTEIKTERPWPYVHIYWNPIWSSDSKRICFLGTRANGKIEVGILNLAGGQPTFRVRADGSEFLQDITWNSRGDQIAMPTRSAPGKPGQILVFDPDGYRPPHRLANQPADQVNGGMCWTRDGGTLIFLTRR